MRLARFSIAGLLGLIGICALGFAALRSPTLLWSQITTTTALTVLLIATVGAFVGESRAFWVGFAILGWSYLILSLGPWFSDQVAPWLLSTRILDELYLRTVADGRGFNNGEIRQAGVSDGPAMDFLHELSFIRFHQIGHSLAAIAHGLFGGVVGVLLAKKRREPSSGVIS